MSEIIIPESLPAWVKGHIELYLVDGEAAYLGMPVWVVVRAC